MQVDTDMSTVRAVVSDVVFPGQLNHHGTLFAGAGLSLMARAAFAAASRAARSDVVMAGCERVHFHQPVLPGDLVEAIATVAGSTGRSITVTVDLVAETLTTGQRRQAVTGSFHLVTITSALTTGAADPSHGKAPTR